MSSKHDLKLDWCSHEAAKFAVMHWHYSRKMPAGRMSRIGVWECGKFIGVIIYGGGATSALLMQYGLGQFDWCELTRVALSTHQSPVSRILAVSNRMIKKAYPGLRVIVSFADPEQGHHGGIYQAGGWIFTGRSTPADEYIVKGKRYHGRSFRSLFPSGFEKDPRVTVFKGTSKLRYVMPLDNAMRIRILESSLVYPKRVSSVDSDTSPDHGEEGGAIPTETLFNE